MGSVLSDGTKDDAAVRRLLVVLGVLQRSAVNHGHMNKRTFLVLVSVLIVGCAPFVYVAIRGNTDSNITPLVACRSVPTNLSENTRHWYNGYCTATTPKQRIQSLVGSPYFQPSEVNGCLPLCAGILATDDYEASDFRRTYVAGIAAEVMARAGVEAIPYFRKALQSKRTVEIQAGLNGIQRLNPIWTGKTNEWLAACVSLLPYVHMQTTNCMAETRQQARAFLGSISGRAQFLESEMKQSLSTTSLKE
jgi:hypothetical protein